MDNDVHVTASELGDYIYCKRGWWLKQHGLLGVNDSMVSGTKKHESLAKAVGNHTLLIVIAALLIGIGMLGLLVSVLLHLFTP